MLSKHTLSISPAARSNSNSAAVRSAPIACPICGHHNCVVAFAADGQPVDAHCHYLRCSPRAILATLKREKLSPDLFARATAQIDRSIAKAAALKLWNRSQAMQGTPGQQYLKRRGLTISPPSCLRYNANVLHDRSDGREVYLPAIIACAETSDGKFAGIHRTWLDPTSSDLRPRFEPRKAALGSSSGSVVRLTPYLADTVVLCEGIEDGLSIVQATELTVWSTLGTNIRSVRLPDCVKTVILAADNDAAGQKAVRAAAKHFYTQGREVHVVRPRPGIKDFNDQLRAPA